jgi:hypothetical protein
LNTTRRVFLNFLTEDEVKRRFKAWCAKNGYTSYSKGLAALLDIAELKEKIEKGPFSS